MRKPPRITEPGLVYLVLNRRMMRLPLFKKDDDYLSRERLLAEGLHSWPVGRYPSLASRCQPGD